MMLRNQLRPARFFADGYCYGNAAIDRALDSGSDAEWWCCSRQRWIHEDPEGLESLASFAPREVRFPEASA